MMIVKGDNTATGWCCVDCLIYLANGEETDTFDRAGFERMTKGTDDITLGLRRDEHQCDYDADWSAGHCYCETREFSWSSCDVCGSTLGGERHAVTFWFTKEA